MGQCVKLNNFQVKIVTFSALLRQTGYRKTGLKKISSKFHQFKTVSEELVSERFKCIHKYSR